MKKGLYMYRHNVYYGRYDENQVNGSVLVSEWVTPEQICMDYPIKGDDYAVMFYDNHRLLEPELADLQTMLDTMRLFANLNADEKVRFADVEKRLGCKLPKELKLIYTAIHNREEYFSSDAHFLPLEEIYVEQGVLVFFKKKRTPLAGYNMASGRLAGCCKKQWEVFEGDNCVYQCCISWILRIAIDNKPAVRKGRCKGEFVTTLNIEEELIKFCTDQYHLLTGLNIYGMAVMYSDDGLVAVIQSNGFYADIHAGAASDAELVALGEHLGQISWKL